MNCLFGQLLKVQDFLDGGKQAKIGIFLMIYALSTLKIHISKKKTNLHVQHRNLDFLCNYRHTNIIDFQAEKM